MMLSKSVKSEGDKDITKKVSIWRQQKDDHHWHATDPKNQIAVIYAQEKFKVVKAMSTII
jgi:hypothetical protein